MYVIKKSVYNPILIPNKDHYWEGFATFNMCPIKKGKTTYGLYRALSTVDKICPQQQISIIGISKSKDGVHFEDRRPFVEPDQEWDIHGCEDPRVTFFEGKYYIFYTALSRYPFGPEAIKVGVAVSKDLESIEEKHLVTPFNAKAMTLFPKRINGKITVVFSAHTDRPPAKVCFAEFDKIEDLWDEKYWEEWIKDIDKHSIDFKRNEYDHLEIGAPPVLTKQGWLLVYSHIQNYFSGPENLDRIFGIEALLLDTKNPTKIIGRTKGPMLVPEEPYELSGYIPDVIFPSGALLDKDVLTVYYGATDTTTCIARVNINDLLSTINFKASDSYGFKRFKENPILVPDENHQWESKAVFNPAAIKIKNKIHLLYRALSGYNTSYFGYASTKDGVIIDERLADPVYVPREEFEMKKIENGNSGCEDPRLTKIGNELYVCYTAYDSVGPPRVAISSIKEKDFVAHKWNWSKPILITPPGLDDKDTCLLPEKFNGQYFVIHRVAEEICGDYIDSLDFEKNMIDKCIRSFGPRRNTWDSSKVGISAPPIKTKYGWLLLYHGVSKSHNTYRTGAVLLDLKDPTIVISRSTDPIFEPEEDYEKFGVVNNVVFPCGMVVLNDYLYIYYGGADKVVGVAKMKLNIILKSLVNGRKFNEK
ncbi:MAG: hypothetical protein PHT84_05290 [Candidatus Pacebacteria bacterium]|nr:hypothetical protein [Candidatus Paceibacterota bacterium]